MNNHILQCITLFLNLKSENIKLPVFDLFVCVWPLKVRTQQQAQNHKLEQLLPCKVAVANVLAANMLENYCLFKHQSGMKQHWHSIGVVVL